MVDESVKQLAVAVGINEMTLLLYHFARQFSVGSASGWTLIAGIELPIISLLFWMIADIAPSLTADRKDHHEGADFGINEHASVRNRIGQYQSSAFGDRNIALA